MSPQTEMAMVSAIRPNGLVVLVLLWPVFGVILATPVAIPAPFPGGERRFYIFQYFVDFFSFSPSQAN